MMETTSTQEGEATSGGKLLKGGGGSGGGSSGRYAKVVVDQQQEAEQDSTVITKCSNKSPRKRQQQQSRELSSDTEEDEEENDDKPISLGGTESNKVTEETQNDTSEDEEKPQILLRSLRNRTIVSNNTTEKTAAGTAKSKTMKYNKKIGANNGCDSDDKSVLTGEKNKKTKKSEVVTIRNNSFSNVNKKGDSSDADSNYCCAQINRRQVLSYAEAPPYLKFNPYITGGYRTALTPRECVRSLFWWTNETINIWSHLLGWMFFLGLSIYDSMGLMTLPNTHPWDRAIVVMLLIAFQACTLLSALYHVFCCCSERFYRRWLSADLFGVSLSLLAIYVSGIYYAFSCVPIWLNFYLITVAAIFVSAMVLQIIPVVRKPTTAEAFHWRLVVFGGWAAYGIVPTMHWALLHGGTSSPVVSLLLPRIFAMYGISMAAFFFYVLRVPEKLYPGLVNFIGSSHQIWHILIVVAFYHWHNTGILYLQFRANNLCQDEYAFLYSIPSVDQTVEAK